MKKLFLLLVFLLCPHFANAQAIVQSLECSQNTVTSKVCTPSNAGSGNSAYVVANINAINGVAITGSMTNGNTMTPADTCSVSGGTQTINNFVVNALNSGAFTYTAGTSPATSTNFQTYFFEISGLNTAGILSAQHGCNSGNSASMTPGSITTTVTSTLILCYFSGSGSISTTVSGTGGTGWTVVSPTQSFAQCFTQLSAPAGTYNPTATTLSSNWVADIVSLIPTGGGGGGQPIFKHRESMYGLLWPAVWRKEDECFVS